MCRLSIVRVCLARPLKIRYGGVKAYNANDDNNAQQTRDSRVLEYSSFAISVGWLVMIVVI